LKRVPLLDIILAIRSAALGFESGGRREGRIMPDIYICGHGGWGIIGRSSIFVRIPAATEVLFYKEIGDVLYVSEAEAIMRRAPDALRPARTVGASTQCPDMTLYPAREFWNNFGAAAQAGGVPWHAVAAATRLSQFLERYRGARIHWIACSVRELR
jgi:hypothetical protein